MNPHSTILIIEDNPDDVFFMQRACKAAEFQNPLQVAVDGQQAIDYLAGTAPFADREVFPLPCLVFLDLKLPRKNGHEVLQWIRSREEFVTLIVVALTTSREPSDITEAYRRGANAYLVKPTSPTHLAEMLSSVKKFWIENNIVE